MSTIQNFWVSNTQLSSDDRGTLGIDSATTYPSPTAVTVEDFRSWTLTRQNAYLDAKGSGTPKSVTVGPVGGDQITVKRSTSLAVEFQVSDRTSATASAIGYYAQNPADPVGVIAKSVDFNLGPTLLDPRIFMSWRQEDQVAYLVKNGKTPTSSSGPLLIGGSNTTFNNTVKATLTHDLEITGGLVFDVGKAADIPYLNLPGSAQGASSVSTISNPFKALDGAGTRLAFEDRPDGFDTNPTTITSPAAAQTFMEDFAKWHSAYQVEYVKTWGQKQTANGQPVAAGNTALPNGSPAVLKLPTTSSATEKPTFEAFVSFSDPTRLYVVSAIDKAAAAKMSKQDQVNLSLMRSFSTLSGAGLTSASAANVKSVIDNSEDNTATAAIQELRTHMESFADTARADGMPATEVGYFSRQLKVLDDQIATMGVLSKDSLYNSLIELKKRFDRAWAFWDVKAPNPVYVDSLDDSLNPTYKYHYATSIDLDSNENPVSQKADLTSSKGYAVFVAQEKRMCEIIEGRQLLAKPGSLGGATLDAPALVYRFQSLYNSQKEAEVVAETEEINQQNALLKSYAAMQDAVNEVLGRFTKTDGDTYLYLFNKTGVNDFYNLTPRQRLIISMFEEGEGTVTSNASGRLNPIEKLNKIVRPTEDMIDNNASGNSAADMSSKTHNQWSQFATRLSEAVTQINQNSQLKMNDVNSLDKERNRHFELANNALSKLADTLQNIARAG